MVRDLVGGGVTVVTRPLIVGIAGGSGSGKTTLTRALVDALRPLPVAVLGHDAYYRHRTGADADTLEAVDYDVPEALDQHAFVADLGRLRRGEVVEPPRYCFRTHRRVGLGPSVSPQPVVLVDGILLFHDREVRAMLDVRIFLDAPLELRSARRLARDTVERGRSPESVLRQLAASVCPAHVAYVEPTKVWAEVILLNAGALRPLVEVAATVIRRRLAAHAALSASRRPPVTVGAVTPGAEELPGAHRISA